MNTASEPGEIEGTASPHARDVGKYIATGTVLGAVIGGALGLANGCSATHAIAEAFRARGELVCGTGFPAIVLGTALIGVLLGSPAGLLLGWMLARLRARTTQHEHRAAQQAIGPDGRGLG